jgi:hypothetical protein
MIVKLLGMRRNIRMPSRSNLAKTQAATRELLPVPEDPVR